MWSANSSFIESGLQSCLLGQFGNQYIPSTLIENLNPQSGSSNAAQSSFISPKKNDYALYKSIIVAKGHSDISHVERSHLIFRLIENLQKIGYHNALSKDEAKLIQFIIIYQSLLTLGNVRLLQARSTFYDGVVQLQENRKQLLLQCRDFSLENLKNSKDYADLLPQITKAQHINYSSEKELHNLFCTYLMKAYNIIFKLHRQQSNSKAKRGILEVLARIVYIRSLPKMNLKDQSSFKQFNTWRESNNLFPQMQLNISDLQEYFESAKGCLLAADITYKIKEVLTPK